MVEVRLRPFILKNVLVMIGAKWAAIFPLRVASRVAFSDRDPASFTHRLARPRVDLFKPRDDQRSFCFELTEGDVLVRQRAVEWMLGGYGCSRAIVARG